MGWINLEGLNLVVEEVVVNLRQVRLEWINSSIMISITIFYFHEPHLIIVMFVLLSLILMLYKLKILLMMLHLFH